MIQRRQLKRHLVDGRQLVKVRSDEVGEDGSEADSQKPAVLPPARPASQRQPCSSLGLLLSLFISVF